MYCDKEKVSKLLINCAVRQVFSGECAVSNHLIILSAGQIVREFAKAQKICLPNDISDSINPEYRQEFNKLQKSRYNFFKHAERDGDIEIDITNIQISNELDLLMAQGNHICIFGSQSRHMHVFYIYMTFRFGKMFDISAFGLSDTLRAQMDAEIERNGAKTRSELCEMFAEILRQDKVAQGEFEEARLLALSEQIARPSSPVRGDMYKRKKGEYPN